FRYNELNNHFTEVIRDIMKDQSLTPQQAVDAMWLHARQDTWSCADLIPDCIADYAALHPRLAQARPPVSTGRPPSPPRYYRPVPPETSPAPQSTRIHADSQNPSNLTSTQLFSSTLLPGKASPSIPPDPRPGAITGDPHDHEILTSTQLFSSTPRPRRPGPNPDG